MVSYAIWQRLQSRKFSDLLERVVACTVCTFEGCPALASGFRESRQVGAFVSTVLVAELGSLFVSCAWWVNVRSWLTVGVQNPRPVHLSNASRAQSLRPLRGRESSSASHQRPSGNAAASFPGEMSTGNSRVGSLAPHGRSRPRLSYLVAVQRRRATWRSLARATEITKTACRIPMTCTVRTSKPDADCSGITIPGSGRKCCKGTGTGGEVNEACQCQGDPWKSKGLC